MQPKEFVALDKRSQVTVETYNKPVRFYCDVDGVLALYFDTLDARAAHLNHARVNLLHPSYGSINVESLDIEWNHVAADALSVYSHSSQVDFVWLTQWRLNAPATLDALFNIKSKGYLPWSSSPTDYGQFFKAVALVEDQKIAPSPFVWIDDIAATANAVSFFGREGLDMSRALVIKTEMTLGLTIEHIKRIDDFLLERRKVLTEDITE